MEEDALNMGLSIIVLGVPGGSPTKAQVLRLSGNPPSFGSTHFWICSSAYEVSFEPQRGQKATELLRVRAQVTVGLMVAVCSYHMDAATNHSWFSHRRAVLGFLKLAGDTGFMYHHVPRRRYH